MLKERDILVLQHGMFNTSNPEVVDLSLRELPETVTHVDLVRGTWRPSGHEQCLVCKGELKINETVLNCEPKRYHGVIGLFDRKDTEQINRMMLFADEAMEGKPM